jgi:hypothetical protein
MQIFKRLKSSPRFRQTLIHIGLAVLLGFAWYLVLYGRYPLYFTHVNWIYKAGGDALMHNFGWEWFRKEPWQFPLGKINAYGYPIGTSVTFLDAIPLLAIPLKLLSPWLGPRFQYFGLWELASVIGQVLLGLLILHEFTRSYPLKILGASLLVLSPPMIFRAFYHESLSAHWLILAAAWFILLERRQRLWRGAWPILFTVAMLIQAYWIPMLLPLWIIGMYFHYQRADKKWPLILDTLGSIAFPLIAGYITGMFEMGFQSLSATGFGVFSWNLNGFFNPFKFSSAFMKDLATGTGGQYEGFSYLGLGNLIILPVAIYLFLEKEYTRRMLAFLLPFGAAALVYMLFALSNEAYFFDRPLWIIPLSAKVMDFFNIFRASGRFVWPIFYFLVLFGIIIFIRNIRHPLPVLALVILLQFIDLQPLIESKKFTGFVDYQSPMQAEFWNQAAKTNQHVVVIPKYKLTLDLEPIAIYAVHNNLTMNLGYFTRSNTLAYSDYAQQVWVDLKVNQSDPSTIYILTEPEWIDYARANLAGEMYVCEVDGYNVLFSSENGLTQTGFDLSPYCSNLSQ